MLGSCCSKWNHLIEGDNSLHGGCHIGLCPVCEMIYCPYCGVLYETLPLLSVDSAREGYLNTNPAALKVDTKPVIKDTP